MSPRCVAAAAAYEKDRTGSTADSPFFLTLGYSVSLLSSNRAVDPSRLEVTTGYRLNQSKPRFISLLPTRIISLLFLFLSLFLSFILSLRISLCLLHLSFFTSAPSPSLYSFLSPQLSPSCLFQAWIIHRP